MSLGGYGLWPRRQVAGAGRAAAARPRSAPSTHWPAAGVAAEGAARRRRGQAGDLRRHGVQRIVAVIGRVGGIAIAVAVIARPQDRQNVGIAGAGEQQGIVLALGRGGAEALIEQRPHGGIAQRGRAPAHDHADQAPAVMHGGGREIIARIC